MTYTRLVNGPLLDWALGAADRQNITAIPPGRLPPKQQDDRVLGVASKDALKIVFCLYGITAEVEQKIKGIKSSDSIAELSDFKREFREFIEPCLRLLQELATAQMRFDLRDHPELSDYVALLLVEGGAVVGLTSADEVMDRVIPVLMRDH